MSTEYSVSFLQLYTLEIWLLLTFVFKIYSENFISLRKSISVNFYFSFVIGNKYLIRWKRMLAVLNTKRITKRVQTWLSMTKSKNSLLGQLWDLKMIESCVEVILQHIFKLNDIPELQSKLLFHDNVCLFLPSLLDPRNVVIINEYFRYQIFFSKLYP